MEAIHKMNLNELKDLGIIAAKRAGDLLNKNKEKEKSISRAWKRHKASAR